jgi:putative DNA methylase
MIQEIDMEYPKKLIEVALPLDDINAASAYEKLPGIGPHPRGIHLWWARRPLTTARAILFAQLVNDPGGKKGYGKSKGQTKADAQEKRERLFKIIRELANWKNTNNIKILKLAQEEIRKSWLETCNLTGENSEKMPPFLDPFAGGGSIPLEAQRLGLEAHASDLNPVAVMINKAMIEIPPKFAGRKPIGPIPTGEGKQKQITDDDWTGAKGLAEDVRRYGYWMWKEARKKIGHLYPEVDLPKEYGGGKATVIAWIWARTVRSPNPSVNGQHVPLISNFFLSTKKGNKVWLEPVIEDATYRFIIKKGIPDDLVEIKKGTKLGRGANFRCIITGSPITPNYIKSEGVSGHMGTKLMAVVAEGSKQRIYLEPDKEIEQVIAKANPEWCPNDKLNHDPRAIWCPAYGLERYKDLFTPRQLVALTTFSDLVQEVKELVSHDAKESGWKDDGKTLSDGGINATAYGEAIATYLSFSITRCCDFNNNLVGWGASNEKIMHLFNRQAIPMVWDYGEANILENVVGGFITNVEYQSKCIKMLSPETEGYSVQQDAILSNLNGTIISTDPPYYDNIGYADLSDFFYVWLRPVLSQIFPDIFSTVLTPKEKELVAIPYRHSSKEKAESFFLNGMTEAIKNMARHSHPAFPVTIYYAFKQSETSKSGTVSTGWETFIEAIIRAGFSITGTWPMRSEQSTRMLGMGNNALASSIVLVCRKRNENTMHISRKQFLRELEQTLPEALEDMIGGKEGASPIAPVDLAQAAIGPGMAVYSKYSEVLEADGSQMTVHTALTLINKAIDEYFTQAESDMGSDTRFCVDWFLQYGFKEGPFGEADVLARAKGTTVDGIQKAGVIQSGKGKVRLLKIEEYPSNWDPDKDLRTPVWEACHHIVRALKQSETTAGKLLAKMPEKAESIRQLAYRLYTVCERKKWSEDARNYNELITSWYAIVASSHHVGHSRTQQKLIKD